VTERWELRLYLAGRSPRSRSALENLERICNIRLPGRHRIEVIDAGAHPELARADNVFALPTLIRKSPPPVKRILGDLSTGSEPSRAWLRFWKRERAPGPWKGRRLLELQETLRAIRGGEVDALLVETQGEERTLAFQGAALVELERRERIEESLLQAEMDRSQLLARERLARTEAEEANRLKDEFLATLSHELRTPLSAILTWSHVLRQPGLDASVLARAVDAIDRNARAQSALVADLLDVSRIVTGKFHMNLGPVRLAEVIESAADTIRKTATIKTVRLEVLIEPQADLVFGDASRLQQVVWNLLSNAIRVTPPGGRVQVSVSSVPSGIELSVIDDGSGIDPDFLPHVFDRFRQADSSSTRRHAGLGLGLAIVRHLVELHGGSVEAHNRTDRPGARFLVRLRRPVDPEGEVEIMDASLAGLSLLLVEDDDDSRDALAIALRQCGARVATASSAAEALALLDSERPQALIADIGMPGTDGHELLRSLRSLSTDRGGATPAIALTAYASAQDRQEALRSGFQMHVAKPAAPRDLAVAVKVLLSAGRFQA